MMCVRAGVIALLVAAVSAQTGPDSRRDALFAAIARASAADVARALDAGADANATGADGTPAIMAAVLFGGTDIVDALLAHGADPNRKGPAGTTALLWAVPNLQKVQRLVERGADVNVSSDIGRTPLLVAASYPGTVGVVRFLLTKDADLRAQDRAGATALSLAIRSSDIDVVRFLVDAGLDPASLTGNARRAAFGRYDKPTTDFLLANGPNNLPDVLASTAAWHSPAIVARFIDESGANVNAALAGQYNRTALLTAAASEGAGIETLKVLLDHGADPNAHMTEGESALDYATYSGDRAKIELLKQHGATTGDGPRREEIPSPARGGIADARVSLARGVSRLLDAAPGFRDKTQCISCHHNAMPSLAASAARRKGIAVDDMRDSKNVDDMIGFFRNNVPRMMLGDPAVGGEALTSGYVELALAARGRPLDTVTAAMTHWMLARQMPDGRWLGNGLNRPPSEYSTISHTAIAAGGLKSYPLPGRRDEIARALGKARQWLLDADAKSAEERAMRLMGLVWTDAPQARVAEAVRAVRDRQEAGGGWSQFSRTAPDAYATGLSLYALHVAGVPASDKGYRNGVAFLLGTQYQDGAWLVKTHSFPVQRYFESGFPFGRHQWISAAGTSWATLAIAETLPDVQQPHR